MVIVPVGVKQSGGVVILAIGVEGFIGSGSISRTNAEEIHPELRSFAVTTYIVSGVNPVKLPEAWYAAPMLYSILGPEGVVISMVPLGAEQVGCAVTEPVGVAGTTGMALMVTAVAAEIQPVIMFLAVTL